MKELEGLSFIALSNSVSEALGRSSMRALILTVVPELAVYLFGRTRIR